MDLADKVNKLTEEVTSKSRNLIQMSSANEVAISRTIRTPDPVRTPRKAHNQRVSAIKANTLSTEPRPGTRIRGRENARSEIVQFRLNAALESATFRLMTSQVPALATLTVRNLR
jgi:hypothetical protein